MHSNKLFALILTTALTSPALAQEKPQTLPTVTVTSSPEQGGRADDGYRTEATAVSGFNNLTNIETPFSVKSYSSELLENSNVETIGDLEKLDASITTSYANIGYYPGINVRGFDLNNWSNYRQNGLMIVNQAHTALENKERIEILKGLSALQAGFAAPGGIVNYVTKRPASEPLTNLHLSLNQYGNALAHTDVSRRSPSQRFGMRVNAAVEELRPYVDEAEGERQFGSIALDAAFTDRTRLFFDLDYQRRDQIQQPSLSLTTDGEVPQNIDPKTFLGQPWANYFTRTTTTGAKLEHDLTDRWTLALEGNLMHLYRDDNSVFLDSGAPNGDVPLFAYLSKDETRHVYNTRASAQGYVSTGPIDHNLALGITTYDQRNRWSDGYFDIAGDTNIYNPVAVPLPAGITLPESTVQNRLRERGVFVNDVLSFGSHWDVHLGGRWAQVLYRSLDSDTGDVTSRYDKNVFSPNAALVWKPRDTLSLYASYMEGLEQGGEAPLGTVNQNEQLDPLTSKQYEVGIKADYKDLILEAALFRIDKAAEYIDGSNTYVQDGSQVHDGLELSATGRITPAWTVVASGLLLDASLEETGDPALNGKRPTTVPEYRAALYTEYSPAALEGVTFLGSAQHTASRYVTSDNTAEVDAYTLLGAGARYTTDVYRTPVTLRLNADNLLDERYWDSVGFGALEIGAPRTVWFSASIEF